MELTDVLKALFIETANTIKGTERRRSMARTVQQLDPGGQRRAERELGWNRQTPSAVSYQALVYPPDGGRSPPPIDRPEGLYRERRTDGADNCQQTECAGLLSKQSGQE